MKLDKDICLGARLNKKEVTEIKINGQFLYESEWPDNLNVYTIHIPYVEGMTNPYPVCLSEKEGNYENSYPLYVDWCNAPIINPLPGYPEPSDTLVYVHVSPSNGATFNIKTNYEVCTPNMSASPVKISFVSDIVSIRRDTTSLKGKFGSYTGKNIRKSVLDKLSHVKSDSMSYMFSGCNNLMSIDISNFDTSNVTSMRYMFSGCYKLETIELGDNFHMDKVTDAYGMFKNCYSLKSFNLNNLKIGYLGDIQDLFSGCSSLESLDLSNASINYYAKTYGMLDGCKNLHTLHLDNCSGTAVDKIINGGKFPTGRINGETRKIYCKEKAIGDLSAPEGWEFIIV